MRFLLRVLLVFVVISSLLSLLRALFASSSQQERVRPGSSGGGRLVKDPICGVYIPEATSIQARDKFFCSEECRRKFLAS